jgi:tetratricopeptide (TPR) repeat protein
VSNKLTVSLLGLSLLLVASATLGQQPPATPAGQPAAPGLLNLTGADAKREEELDKAIEAARKTDRWDEAIARAEELLALRTKVQGPKHFETMSVERELKAIRRLAPMPREDRAAYQSAITMNEQAGQLKAQGKNAAAQPLYEKALEIRRRLLTDDHRDTAVSYNNLAYNLNAQGKYAAAQPLYEKALEICRRLLTDDHPQTAKSTPPRSYAGPGPSRRRNGRTSTRRSSRRSLPPPVSASASTSGYPPTRTSGRPRPNWKKSGALSGTSASTKIQKCDELHAVEDGRPALSIFGRAYRCRRN